MQISRPILMLVGFVFCSCVLCTKALADIKNLPDHAREALLREQDFKIINKVGLIPKEAVQAIIKSQGLDEFKMADPGKPFEKTDAVSDERLPYRQLQFAALSKEYLLIRYAKGGFSYRDYVILMGRKGNEYKFVWRAMCVCKNFPGFIQELKSDDRLYDRMDIIGSP